MEYLLVLNADEYFRRFEEIKPYILSEGLIGIYPDGTQMNLSYRSEKDRDRVHDTIRGTVKFLAKAEISTAERLRPEM